MWHGMTAYPHAGTAEKIGRDVRKSISTIKFVNFKQYVLFAYHGNERVSQGMSLIVEDESSERITVIPRQLRLQSIMK